MARSQTLKSPLILLLLYSISNPLPNLMGLSSPPSYPVSNNTSQPLYCYSLIQTIFIFLLDYFTFFLIGVSTFTLIPCRRCYWLTQSDPLKSLLSIGWWAPCPAAVSASMIIALGQWKSLHLEGPRIYTIHPFPPETSSNNHEIRLNVCHSPPLLPASFTLPSLSINHTHIPLSGSTSGNSA